MLVIEEALKNIWRELSIENISKERICSEWEELILNWDFSKPYVTTYKYKMMRPEFFKKIF